MDVSFERVIAMIDTVLSWLTGWVSDHLPGYLADPANARVLLFFHTTVSTYCDCPATVHLVYTMTPSNLKTVYLSLNHDFFLKKIRKVLVMYLVREHLFSDDLRSSQCSVSFKISAEQKKGMELNIGLFVSLAPSLITSSVFLISDTENWRRGPNIVVHWGWM